MSFGSTSRRGVETRKFHRARVFSVTPSRRVQAKKYFQKKKRAHAPPFHVCMLRRVWLKVYFISRQTKVNRPRWLGRSTHVLFDNSPNCQNAVKTITRLITTSYQPDTNLMHFNIIIAVIIIGLCCKNYYSNVRVDESADVQLVMYVARWCGGVFCPLKNDFRTRNGNRRRRTGIFFEPIGYLSTVRTQQRVRVFDLRKGGRRRIDYRGSDQSLFAHSSEWCLPDYQTRLIFRTLLTFMSTTKIFPAPSVTRDEVPVFVFLLYLTFRKLLID